MGEAAADELLARDADHLTEGGVDVEMDPVGIEQHEAVLQVLREAVEKATSRLWAIVLEPGQALADALELGEELLLRESAAARWLKCTHAPLSAESAPG